MNNDYLGMVADFHLLFNVPILPMPQIPSTERCNLRVTLLQEELDELKDSIKNNDLTEVLDAFCDILYILNGSILEFGFQNVLNDAFHEVQRSNMSKACDSMQEAIDTLSHYKQKDGTEGYYKEINGKWIVYRNGDNKVLKSINYSPANLKDILND
jgi:predicted HAD superfamily Cof-like phosphohydrolase